MNTRTALSAAAAITMTVAGGVSALFFAFGSADAAPAVVQTEFVDENGQPLATPLSATPEIVIVAPEPTPALAPSAPTPAQPAAPGAAPYDDEEEAYEEYATHDDEEDGDEDEYEEHDDDHEDDDD